MNEDFVTYEIASKLKEKGFYYKCVATYDNDGMLGYNYIQPTNIRAIGFDDCLYSHNVENDNCIDAPTISQVLKWLREEKKIFIAINIGYCYESDEIPFPTNPKMEPILKGYYYGIWELDNLNDKNTHSEYFEAPELAAIAGIEYVLDNLI